MSDNEQRAHRAYAALLGYLDSKREVFEGSSSEIVDLVTDLLHLAARWDQGDDPIGSTLRLAVMHFEAEQTEEENCKDVARDHAQELLAALEAVKVLIDKYGIGDDDAESEPVVARMKASITKARGQA